MPMPLVEAWLSVKIVIIIVLDWDAAAVGKMRLWPLVVLVLDMLLVVDARPSIARVSIAAMVLWLSAERAEAITRFGLYE
eukprot:gene12503-32729_t